MFGLFCGLIHIALTPKKSSLPRKLLDRLEDDIATIKQVQLSNYEEFEAFKEDLYAHNQAREQKIVSELQSLAVMIGQFAAKKQTQMNNLPPNVTPIRESVRSQKDLVAEVRDAIESNRVELYIQPVVSLPQRRVSFYEAFTRLRDKTGRIMLPGEFLKVAEPTGMVGEIDNMLLLKCVQIARRMIRRDKRLSMFCNLSATSLADEGFFIQFIDFMKENRDLAGSIIFEIPREAFDRIGMTAERNMGRLYDLGFRFSIDRCETIDLDLRKLERMGVRYVKIAGDKLIKALLKENARPVTGLAREFEATDIASLFARYGVDLIADRIEDERTIVELLDLDLGFAQGNLFGAPKPLSEITTSDDLDTSKRRYAS